jgi:ribonuclease BN (tRNA processing enzyme)
VVSHYHPDHFSDLIPYLHAAAHAPGDRRTEDLHIYGPEGLAAVLERLLSLAGLDSPDSSIGFSVHPHRLEETREIDGLEVEPWALPPAGNHGIRVVYERDVAALTGDSGFHDAEVDFVRGARIAVIDSGHLTDAQIVSLAARARPEILVCSHIYRQLDHSKLIDESTEGGFDGRIVIAEDRMEFPFGLLV